MNLNIVFILLFLRAVITQTEEDTTTINYDQGQDITSLIQKSNPQSIVSLHNKFYKEYSQAFISFYQQQIYRLKSIEQMVILQMVQLEPIFRWAQNISHIFITLKLSHRWDSPPCLNVKTVKSFISSNQLIYDSICIVSHSKINFKMMLQLYSNIVVEGDQNKIQANPNQQTNPKQDDIPQKQKKQVVQKETKDSQQKQDLNNLLINQTKSSIKNSSNATMNMTQVQFMVDGVGTFTIILQKKLNKVWPHLTKQVKYYPIWQETALRYPQTHNEHQQLWQKAYQKYKKSSFQFSLIIGCLCFWFIIFII